MLTRWNTGWSELDEMFSSMNQLRTQMDRMFEDASAGRYTTNRTLPLYGGTWPRANLIDSGSKLMVTAEVPGMTDKDIQLTLNQDVLHISGQRTIQAPAGYSVHRQERATVNFSRSFALPCSVNPENASASVKEGVLTVVLEKAPDAMPRQIAVKAAE